ncbi:MAG TPA: EamA family transporter, partial [Cytophagales bacterium]|nr:EamA family transporter [Cytophagales bacterium]
KIIKSEKFKAYFALACVCFFWGTTYLALRIGVAYIPPFLFSGTRQVIAGMILISWFLVKGNPFPPFKELLIHIICGTLMIAVGNGLVAWAELYVSSGLAALICSLVPIWIILINVIIRSSETINLKIITGSLLGLCGLVLIFNDNLKDFANPNYLYGIVAIILANIGWAIGTIINKRSKSQANPLFAAGLQVFSGGLIMLIVSFLMEDLSTTTLNVEGIGALIYLILFGTVLAFGAFIYALSKLPTTIVSLYAYINPLVAIILGWLILNERLNLTIWIAFAITISGVYLVNKGFAKNK